ncbi:hypothetical protein BH11BAC2_BH11BAC2_08390 [soil metagenome]
MIAQKPSKKILKDLIYNEDTLTLREYLENGFDLQEQCFAHGNTLIHYALYQRKSDVANWLIKNGVPCDLKNNLGFTPLGLAIINRDYVLMNLMLNQVCNVSTPGYMGNTAISNVLFNFQKSKNRAVEYSALQRLLHFDKNINYTCPKYKNTSYMMQCVSWADTLAAKMLTTHDIQLNTRDRKGMTALHYAVQLNKPDFVSFLISQGASTSIKNNNGKTPVDLAKKKRNDSILSLLNSNKN